MIEELAIIRMGYYIVIKQYEGSCAGYDPTTLLAMTSFGIPFTGSMSAGFTIGFMKG